MAVSSQTGKPHVLRDANQEYALNDGDIVAASACVTLPDHHTQMAEKDPRQLAALICAPLLSLLDRHASDPTPIRVAVETAGGPGQNGRSQVESVIDVNLTWSSLSNTLASQIKGLAMPTGAAQAAVTVATGGCDMAPPHPDRLRSFETGDAPAIHVAGSLTGSELTVTLSSLRSGPAAADPGRLLDHYLRLLDHAANKPGHRVAYTPLLTDEERERITVSWNDTSADVPDVQAIHEVIQAQAHAHPEAVAVVCREQRITYRQLNERANQLAHYLRRQGLKKGARVGLLLDRHPDLIMSILAVLKAGGAYVPLDAGYPMERLVQIFGDAKAAFVVTHGNRDNIPPTGARIIDLQDRTGAPWRESADDPETVTTPEDTAFVLFTSGSTAQPKGVMVTHANLINYHAAWQRHCRLSDNVSAVCQMAHVSFAVFQGDWVRALCFGKRLVMCPRETLSSPRLLHELMVAEGVDFAEFVPSLLRALFLHCRDNGRPMDFLRTLVVGADRWYMREHRLLQQHCPGTRVIHVYGSSETTLDSTFFEGTSEPIADHQLAPIGRPIMNVRTYVVDRHLQPVPIGMVGELLVAGAGVAKGYLARETLTAERFIPDPFEPADGRRLFRTGDMVSYLPDGNIAFHGRRDHQVKIRGFRVDLGEVEQAVERYPSVRQAIAHAVKTAQDEHQLALYFVTHHGQQVELEWLRMHCQRYLPDYMVPSHLVHMEALPLTSSGKIDRKALPSPWQDPADRAPESVEAAGDGTVQRVVAEICCHALGRASIEPHEDFALLGCDSMAIVSMIMGIEDAFGFPLDETDINPQVFSSVANVTAFVQRRLQG